MGDIYTFPAQPLLLEQEAKTPDHMRPNHQPWIVIGEGHLPGSICDEISSALLREGEIYSVRGCNAYTHECNRPLDKSMDQIASFTRQLNDICWEYDLDEGPSAWLQTYMPGDDYQLHMDAMFGQMRKLTAVALLTDPDTYDGGTLSCKFPTQLVEVPRTRGTIVIFPFWVLHEVSRVTNGLRQTLNMGFYGPPFR